MSLTIEHLHHVRDGEHRDLQKIYADAPAALLAPFPNRAALLDASTVPAHWVVARFNGHLLGAARLCQNSTIWQLSHLCVRQVTRRRGVANRLITVLQIEAHAQGARLIASHTEAWS